MSGGGSQPQAPTLAAPAVQMHNATYYIPPYRPPEGKWKVWFAWYPVKVEVFRETIYTHDEVATEWRYKWRWLCNVARRHDGVSYMSSGGWDYAPAHKALTQ